MHIGCIKGDFVKSKTVRFSVVVPETDKEELDQAAASAGYDRADVIRHCIRVGLPDWKSRFCGPAIAGPLPQSNPLPALRPAGRRTKRQP